MDGQDDWPRTRERLRVNGSGGRGEKQWAFEKLSGASA